jgi:hypothetical protein
LLEVWLSVPWEKLRVRWTPARTPETQLQSPWAAADWSEVAAPVWRRFWYIRSSKTTGPALEAVGADVGEVVGDGVELGLLAFHAGLGDPQRSNHESGSSGSADRRADEGLGIGR